MLSVSGMLRPGLQAVSFNIDTGEVKLDRQYRETFSAPQWRKLVTYILAKERL